MENKRYDKLKASFEASQPPLPPDFTERVMREIEHKPTFIKCWRWIAAAACLLILIGTGVTLLKDERVETKSIAKVESIEKTAPPMLSEAIPEETQALKIVDAKQEKTVKPSPLNNRGYAQRTHGKQTIKGASTLKECPIYTVGNSSRVAPTDKLNYYISKLESEMDALDDSVRAAHVEKLIAADARLQQLVYRIVKEDVEQAINELKKDSTANYINF